MRVRYLQSRECILRCGPYYSPAIDLDGEEPSGSTGPELQKYAQKVCDTWTDLDAVDDNFHTAVGVVFELDTVQPLTCVYTFVNGKAQLEGGFFRE